MDFQIVSGPTLLGPASSTFNTRPSFSWTNMSGTVGGTESVVPVYDFRLDVVLPNNVVQANFRTASGLTSPSYTLPTALPVGRYRAMVLARTSDTTSNYINIVEFYVGGNPVVNAIGSTTDTTPTISWRPVDGASGYQIFIALDSNPTVPVVQQLGIGSLSRKEFPRHREVNVLFAKHLFRNCGVEMSLEEFKTFLNHDLGSTRASRDSYRLSFGEPFPSEFAGSVDEVARNTSCGPHFHQAATVGTVLTSEHDQDVGRLNEHLHGFLPIRRGVADIFFFW
jgi:hypothetical protein